MPSKLQAYTELSQLVATRLTGSYEEWTAFLATAGRLYKYPFPDQMMIYAQRPDATACAEYEFWNEKMRRYVLRGAKGIALIDTSGDKAHLRYVFDVSDTGGLENARRPRLWQYRPEHQRSVAAALETRYGISGAEGFADQLEKISANLAAEYWEDHQKDILGIVDGSFLEEYDAFSVGEQFQSAAFVSIAYTLMSRCGLEPESYFSYEDFMSIFDFSTVPSATALGMAVSQSSEQVLRQIEAAIRTFEREKRRERSASHGEQADVQPERGLPHPGPEPGGPAVPALGQVREDAPEISEGVPSSSVGGTDGERDVVLPPAGNRPDGQREAGEDDAGAGGIGGGNGGAESQQSMEVGGLDEHLQGPGGGNDPGGAGVRLNSHQERQISLFPSEQQQIEDIQEAESANAPSASAISQEDIDAVLRSGPSVSGGKLYIYEQYQNGISATNAVKLVKREYGESGRSFTFQNGTEGYVDSRPSRGLIFWHIPGGEEVTVSWAKVEKRIRQLVQEGTYLTQKELEQFRQEHPERAQPGESPVPEPDSLVSALSSTSFQTDYFALKEAHPGDIVLYQMGDFFEMFGPDARVASLELDLMRTTRHLPGLGRVDMCGIPAHALESYAERLRSRHNLTVSAVDAKTNDRNVYTLRSTARETESTIDTLEAESTAPEESTSAPAAVPEAEELSELQKESAEIAKRYETLPMQDRIDAMARTFGCTTGKIELSPCTGKWRGSSDISIRFDNGASLFLSNYSTPKAKTAKVQKETVNAALARYNPEIVALAKETALAALKKREPLDNAIAEQRGLKPYTLLGVELNDGSDSQSGGYMGWYYAVIAIDGKIHAHLETGLSSDISHGKVSETPQERGYYTAGGLKDADVDYVFNNVGFSSTSGMYSLSISDAVRERAEKALAERENGQPIVSVPEGNAEGTKTVHEPATETSIPTVGEQFDKYKPVVFAAVMEDTAYRNACGHSDHENAVIEGNAAVRRVILGSGDMELLRLYSDMPEFRRRLQQEVIDESYPQLHELLRPLSQNDIDEALQSWNGDVASKRRVVRYMEAHGRERSAAEWLSREYGGAVDKNLFVIRQGSPETVELPWPKVQRRIAQLIKEDRFFTRQELDNFEDIDTAAVRERLESGEPSAFVEQVEADVERIAAAGQPPRDPLAPAYKPGDTVYLDNTAFEITGIGLLDVQLRDPALPGPHLRTESKENFERLLYRDPRNSLITSYLSADLHRINEDFREVLTKHLLTDRDKDHISAWIRSGENNREIAQRLSLAFASRAETVTLETGDIADFFTSTISMEVEIQDKFYTNQAMSWEDVASVLRALWQQELDGFSHEPVQRESVVPDHDQPKPAPGRATIYPGEKNGLPFDVVVETLPVDGPEHAQPKQAPTAEQNAAAENFRITDDNLGVGGPRVKYRMNVEAIRTLKQIEREGRSATAEEQKILSRYVGWGGVPDAFDKKKTDWLNEYDELKELLNPEEYKSAMASTLNAHYTSPVVIKAIYEAVENMGFQSGKILEPSCGVGNFFGLLPESMAASKLYGVELDSITGRIARQLYPKASIAVQGFEKTNFPNGFFDLAIGNVPFGNYKVVDQRYDRENFLIHDYFFAKTIDKVRPGGVIAFITSNGISGGTMDKKDDRARRYMAQRCDLLGAVRLPDGTFQANAGTDTSMTIMFLQKRAVPLRETDPLPDWVSANVIENHTYIGKDGQEHPGFVSINRYFQAHPEMVLGDLNITSGPFGPQLVCSPRKDVDFAQQLREAISHIHGEFTRVESPELDVEPAEETTIPADANVKEYSYAVIGGDVYYRENTEMSRLDLSATAKGRVVGMVELRDCVRRLIDLQMRDGDESAIVEEQRKLNTLYDAFTAKYGLINSRENSIAFSQDNSYYLLCSLEVVDEDGRLERKADMFTKRTIKPHQAVTHVDTASEALAVSIGEHASVDLPYMAQLTGKTEEELERELSGVIFRDIQCEERADWIPAASMDLKKFPLVSSDEYLSGNVRRKLRMAKAMYEVLPDGEKYQVRANVEALENAQPRDLEASEIDLRLGATWLDKRYVQQFMYGLFQTTVQEQRFIHVEFSEFTGDWSITGKTRVGAYSVAANTTYGTDRLNAYDILEDTLNLRDVRVYDTVWEDGKERRVLNQKETTLAAQKQQMIKDAFRDWIWKDPQRRQDLVRQYNELFNSIRPREYDGRHIVFGGINPEITLREHQVNAIAHTLYGGNTLLAHEVGAGKTFEMVASAMESKRLGLCRKSLFAVPNHLVEQWASEFLRLYPSANILVTRKKDFEKANRKKFCARIATGNYDAIIMGHSQFERIPISFERRKALLEDQINEIEQGIGELESSGAERFTVKQLERTKKSLEARLEKLQDTRRKDDVVTFEQLGVDRLFVDEAHSYKNLFLYTKMRNVAGLSTTDAQKSSDMLLKCRYMDEITGGRGVVFATGTPVSNSMTELFTMQRYLQQNLLEKGFTDSRGRHYSLTHFDSWASIFGETVTTVELAPEGKYRPRTRFARFFNLPELMAMFRETADIKTADQLHLPVPEVEYHTVKALPSEEQKELVKELADRAEAVHGGIDPKIDNMLKVTSDGRKLGLDQRLINPLLPDNPESKVNLCVNNVFRIWQDGQADKLTQLLFCDLSTPKAAAAATRDKTAMAAGNKTAGGTELHALGTLLEDIKPDPPFSVYEDIRQKLVSMGIPEREIAFIHDADTDAKKKALFSKVRSGQVRILMGSTFKMGAGMNVQDRLIALHDLDCPWRPGDLEQRKGRIVRQGNNNKTVHIYRYVTEGTFDSYLWQTVENKQKFISQIMTSKSPVRSCEDVDETALSYAEIKALCAGNPLIKQKMDLDIDVARLRLLRADHQSKQYRMEDNLLRRFPEQIKENEEFIAGLEADMKTLAEHPHPTIVKEKPAAADGEPPAVLSIDGAGTEAPSAGGAATVVKGFAGMEFNGQLVTDKAEAGKLLLAEMRRAAKIRKDEKNLNPLNVGNYRGFSAELTLEDFGSTFVLTLKGQMTHRAELGEDVVGNFLRMDHTLEKMPDRIMRLRGQISDLQDQMKALRKEVGKPFPQEAELQEKSARLAELNAELGIDDGAAAPPAERRLAKEVRPSILNNLKRPLPPRQADETGKARKREPER